MACAFGEEPLAELSTEDDECTGDGLEDEEIAWFPESELEESEEKPLRHHNSWIRRRTGPGHVSPMRKPL